MKVLHTSDWHIGKKLQQLKDRLQEQEEVLNEICDVCDKKSVELVLVAGDIYDTFTPSAEAENLFFNIVKKLAGNDRAVVIISGNHDDCVRLSASAPLAEEFGIYIVGDNKYNPTQNNDRKVKLIESQAGYMIFENEKGERVYINTLPYPNEARFKECKSDDETFRDKMSRWISFGERGNDKKLPSIFLSHLFVGGGQVSESERDIDLGGARVVGKDLLPNSDYIALGHLHKYQKLSNEKNIYYCGSILQYAFDECNADKYVLTFDISKNGVSNIEKHLLTKGKKLGKIEANSIADAVFYLKANADKYIELTLNLSKPMSQNDVKELKEVNENFVKLNLNVAQNTYGAQVQSKKQLSSKELFFEFYKSQFNSIPEDDLTELFLSLTEGE